MAIYYVYHPGPSITPEYASADALRAAIASTQTPLFQATSAGGGSPSGDWLHPGWSQSGGGQPFLQIEYQGRGAASGHYCRHRYRFSTAVLGTLDPSAWWDGVNDPSVGKWTTLEMLQAVYAYGTQYPGAFHTNLPTVVRSSGLCSGTFNTNTASVRLVPAGSPVAGEIFAVHHDLRYDPSGSEYTSGYYPLFYDQLHLGGSGYANVNVAEGDLGIGNSQSTVPVVVINEGTPQEAGWNSLQQTLTQNIWNSNTFVTNSSDLGGGSDATEPAVPDIELEVFTTGNVLPAVVAGTTAITSLTTWPAALLAGIVALGSAAVGWLTNLATWTAAAGAAASNLPLLPTLASQAANSAAEIAQDELARLELIRIADALEAIQAQLTASSPVDGSTMHDKMEEVRASMDAVATSRSEIDLQSKGIRVQAQGGVLEV